MFQAQEDVEPGTWTGNELVMGDECSTPGVVDEDMDSRVDQKVDHHLSCIHYDSAIHILIHNPGSAAFIAHNLHERWWSTFWL
jgi:hypothetical protein